MEVRLAQMALGGAQMEVGGAQAVRGALLPLPEVAMLLRGKIRSHCGKVTGVPGKAARR
jgi:hypothetical protein